MPIAWNDRTLRRSLTLDDLYEMAPMHSRDQRLPRQVGSLRSHDWHGSL